MRTDKTGFIKGVNGKMEKVNILGVKVDTVTIPEAAECIMGYMFRDKFHAVFTPNSEIIMVAYKDPEFCEVLNNADLLTADGIGVVYASKILGKPIKERAAGYDITCVLLEKLNESGHKIFFFGGKPGVADTAKERLLKKYPGLKFVGVRNGYFKPEEEQGIIDEINNSGADILFVGLGAPAQEKWISQNKANLNVKVAMGIGGCFDVFAGRVERAPDIYCRLGLEWFYRLIKEPWRAKRMMALPKFALTVIAKGRKFK